MALAASRTDVVVIGAGLSGMNTAMMLREQGYKVVVLEAGSRVGGRVETVETANGPVDVGASQVGRGYARVLDMCQKLNLRLIPEDRDLLTFGGYLQGQWVDAKTWETNPLNLTVGEERKIPPMMMGSTLASRYNPLKEVDEWLDPKYAEYDISLRELMRRKGHSEAAITLAAHSVSGIGMDQTSMLRMWQEETRGRIDRKLAPEARPASGCTPSARSMTAI
jgi:monoamine oxidase